MNKTPISILQEMMAKRNRTPNYELVHNGGGTHLNTFVYQVTCDGFTATGTGRCKKTAKHEAATALLEKIAKHNSLPQLPASPAQSPIKTPSPAEPLLCPKSPSNGPFRNTVGELAGVCLDLNLGDPIYKEVGDVGPAHARVFTIQCIVSSFVEEGTASTKKQAKHEAARKMINRIADFISDDPNPVIDENKENNAQEAIEKFIEMKQETKPKVNWGLKIKDYYRSLKDSFVSEEIKSKFLDKLENSLTLTQQYQENPSDEVFTQLYQEFESMLELMDIKYYENSMDNTDPKFKFYKGLRLNTAPDIYEFGRGVTEKEASVDAISAVLKTVKLLLR